MGKKDVEIDGLLCMLLAYFLIENTTLPKAVGVLLMVLGAGISFYSILVMK